MCGSKAVGWVGDVGEVGETERPSERGAVRVTQNLPRDLWPLAVGKGGSGVESLGEMAADGAVFPVLPASTDFSTDPGVQTRRRCFSYICPAHVTLKYPFPASRPFPPLPSSPSARRCSRRTRQSHPCPPHSPGVLGKTPRKIGPRQSLRTALYFSLHFSSSSFALPPAQLVL